MSKLHFILSLAVLVMPSSVLAQSQDHAAPPTPPFVTAMPDNSTWTIDFKISAVPANGPAGGRSVSGYVTSKSGLNRAIVSTWTDGSTSAIWFWDGYRLEQKPGKAEVLVTRLPGGHDFQNADFPDLNWLQKKNYVGRENHGGHDCFHFKTQIRDEVVHILVDYSAFIDVKTKRPVAWDENSNHFELASFAIRKADDPLSLPEPFATQLKAYRLAARELDPYKKQ